MKKIFLIFTILFTVSLTAQEINWVTLEEAQELQKKEPRKIMIDAYTVWCGPCKALDRNTFANKDVADYVNKNYYAVKYNAQGNDKITFKGKVYTNPGYKPERAKSRNSNHQLSGVFGIQAFPTLVFLDEDFSTIAPLSGYKTPQQLELFLKLFKSNKHKDMKSQADFSKYAKAFKAEFKN